jgi:toxin ParE1/3/4
VRTIWRPAASRDYASIREYLEDYAPGNAEAVVTRILGTVETLTQFPRLGRPGRLPGTRELVIPRTPYVVVYRVDADEVVILRVRHGALRWPPVS